MKGRQVRVAGHFGEFMQGRIGNGGPVALVTVPCPALAVTACHLPGAGLSVHGGGQPLMTPARARRLLKRLGRSLGGRVVLRAAMPLGGGAGASTAALVALARLAAPGSPPDDIARACVAAEGASDPLMYAAPDRLLWASRAGRRVATLPALPAMEVVGGFFGPPRRTDATDDAFPDIGDLVDPWGVAARAGDLAAIAALASESARRTLAMRGPADDPIAAIARSAGAVGYLIAHTGAARGLIFAPGAAPACAPARLRAAGFRQVITFAAGGGNP